MKRIARAVVILLISIVMVVMTVWGALAIYYSNLPGEGLRTMLAAVFALFGVVLLVWYLFAAKRTRPCFIFLAVFLLLVAWWSTIPASQDRDWAPEYAKLPYATIKGDLVTIHNIRNFDYRTETDFTPAYYDRTFDLRRLDRVDLFSVYWMGPAIAHLFVSFGFGDDHLAVSIEVRKTRSKEYSTVAGFFRQFELVYVAGDERDVIRLRTNYRKSPPEEVYMFRTVAPIENGRRVFLDYIKDMNRLKDQPRFYNTLTTNCTTMILAHTTMNPGHLPMSWKVLLSGYAAEYAYDQGRLDRSLPFAELKRRGHINARAHAADKSPDFSRLIRVGVP